MKKLIRLLIVDDMPYVRQDLCTALSLVGAETIEIVGEASSGREAIQQVTALQPDVVLMDLEMPGMDGYTATRAIKADFPNVKVVALTVHSYLSAQAKARQAGVDDFIEKGTSIAEVFKIILNFRSKGEIK